MTTKYKWYILVNRIRQIDALSVYTIHIYINIKHDKLI